MREEYLGFINVFLFNSGKIKGRIIVMGILYKVILDFIVIVVITGFDMYFKKFVLLDYILL